MTKVKILRKQAEKIVQEHARYYREMPPDSRYGVRWPEAHPRAIFGSSPAQLVEKLLARLASA